MIEAPRVKDTGFVVTFGGCGGERYGTCVVLGAGGMGTRILMRRLEPLRCLCGWEFFAGAVGFFCKGPLGIVGLYG